MDGLNLENLWVFSSRASAKLGLQGIAFLGWNSPRQKSDGQLLNRDSQDLNRGVECHPPPEFR